MFTSKGNVILYREPVYTVNTVLIVHHKSKHDTNRTTFNSKNVKETTQC